MLKNILFPFSFLLFLSLKAINYGRRCQSLGLARRVPPKTWPHKDTCAALPALGKLPNEGRGRVREGRAFFSQWSVMISPSDANEERRSSPVPAVPHAEHGCAHGAVPAQRGGDTSTVPAVSLAKWAAHALGHICAAPNQVGLLTARIMEITYNNKVNRQ